METITKIYSAGIIEGEKGLFIAQRFKPFMPKSHHKWDILIGEHKFGETLEETILRYTKEEIGLTIRTLWIYPIINSYTFDKDSIMLNAIMPCYHCIHIDGKLKIKKDEIKEARWVPIREVRNYDLASPLKEILPMIEAMSINCSDYNREKEKEQRAVLYGKNESIC